MYISEPKQMQSFLGTLRYVSVSTHLRTPQLVLESQEAYCFDAALTALQLRRDPQRTLIHFAYMNQKRRENGPVSHIIVPFKEAGKYGAIAKDRQKEQEWREPIYDTLQQLVESYTQGGSTLIGWEKMIVSPDLFNQPARWVSIEEVHYRFLKEKIVFQPFIGI